jgi:hypothetical protein
MVSEPQTPALPSFALRESPFDRPALPALVVFAALATADALAAGVTAWAVAGSQILAWPTAAAVLRSIFVASYVGLGTYTWWRRPDSRLGPLVAGIGLLFAFTSLNAFSDPLLFTFGRLVLAATTVYTAYVFLCFPRDRLGSPAERRFIGALVVVAPILWAATLALSEKLPAGGAFADCGNRCPHNALQFVSAPDAVTGALRIADTRRSRSSSSGLRSSWTARLVRRFDCGAAPWRPCSTRSSR